MTRLQMENAYAYGFLGETMLGPICLCASEKGLRRLDFVDAHELKRLQEIQREDSGKAGEGTIANALLQLREYFQGQQRQFHVAYDLEVFSEFSRRVLKLTSEIRYGDLATYGQLAAQLGQPKAARAVGRALGANPLPIFIPCHRVLGSSGHLHGYSALGGLATKSALLRLEGHTIQDERVRFY